MDLLLIEFTDAFIPVHIENAKKKPSESPSFAYWSIANVIANDDIGREATTTTTMTTMRRLEKAARDGFIKNFDHQQMGSRMEALVYSGTHDKKERENEEEKERNT
jgi:hypothetical protein